MVLTSDKGWPYTLNAPHGALKDFFVNCEVDRVWQIVSSDLTEWFSNFDLSRNPSPVKRLLIGTLGIGKPMAAGSYLFYQPLHYDIEKPQLVVYSFGGSTTYVFGKTIKTVTIYVGSEASEAFLYYLWRRGTKGYIIHDVVEKEAPPASYFLPYDRRGMIVVSSPNVRNYSEWEAQVKAERTIVNCPDGMDVKAMCAWMKRDGTTDDQAAYWKMVKGRMDSVGPISRYIFDANKLIAHSVAIENALGGINSRDGEEHFMPRGVRLWYSENPT
ncbi:retrotransposon hot spot (RHS) protein, putative [Trypanosoma cruzi marinkellei]|uniref:Retrotransposon hot spot (RHS) protein, putative n=1 Tax=Trypanosoma cruzi marinkellei TaxID=85056 RepID=K2MVU3_TRYCR|nr:retrotransposon hot spot (RHS) protein, putative [Trypanosoma cruzi marinkellei]EKF39368.1 retrotransposon hot spot (RHS) protein, putative [Trypanosoma cruzi marinkellei]